MNLYFPPTGTEPPKPVSVPVPPESPLHATAVQRVTLCGAAVRFFHTIFVPVTIVFADFVKQYIEAGVQLVPDKIFTDVRGTAAPAAPTPMPETATTNEAETMMADR